MYAGPRVLWPSADRPGGRRPGASAGGGLASRAGGPGPSRTRGRACACARERLTARLPGARTSRCSVQYSNRCSWPLFLKVLSYVKCSALQHLSPTPAKGLGSPSSF